MSEFNKDLLTDEALHNLVLASNQKRLTNYLIDAACFFVVMILILIGIIFVQPDLFDQLTADTFLSRIIFIFLYSTFIGIVEGLGKGKTLGKIITRTRAVNIDGTVISFNTAFFRGMCRAVPFNAFSGLGMPCKPWHDRWTNTLVIDEQASSKV